MKRVLGILLAGMIGAGTLFSGISVVNAQDDITMEETTAETTITDEATTEETKTESSIAEEPTTEEIGTQEADGIENKTNENADTEGNQGDTNENIQPQNPDSISETTNETEYVDDSVQVENLTEENDFKVLSDVQMNYGGGDGDSVKINSGKRLTVLNIDWSNDSTKSQYPNDELKEATKEFCKTYFGGGEGNHLMVYYYGPYLSVSSSKRLLGKEIITNLEDAIKVIDKDFSGTYKYSVRNIEVTLRWGLFSEINYPDYSKRNIVVLSLGEPNDSSVESMSGYTSLGSGLNGPFTANDSVFYTYGNKALERANQLPDNVNVYTIGFFEEESEKERDYCQRLMEVITKGEGKYYDVSSYAVLSSTFEQVAYDIVGKSNIFTSTTSPYADNYNLLVSGSDLNGKSFKNLSTYIYKDNSAIIPGIEQTNMADNSLCKNMVAQGVCMTDKYMLISAYCEDKDHSSVIYVLDKNTRKYITTLVLNEWVGKDIKEHISHVGSIEYTNGAVYIADSGNGDEDYRIWKLAGSDIERAVSEGKDAQIVYMTEALDTEPLEHKPSFIEIYNGNLYIGTFDENNDDNKLYVHNLNTGEYKERVLHLNVGKAQGISFFEKDGQTFCAISSSHGRENTSKLYISECRVTDGEITHIFEPYKTIEAPNMSEDMDISGDELLVAFESGANYYAKSGEDKLRPLDRVVSIDYKRLAARDNIPVIIVPGIMGSNLYKDGAKVWAPSGSDLIPLLLADRLKINTNLTVKNYDDSDKPIKQNLEGSNREYGANNSYKELVDGLCNSTGKSVYFFSYDWRQDNAESARKLYEFIEKVKDEENTAKVDIVAHSMGGLVTSYYASHKFNSEGKEIIGDEQINRVITCGTPYEGSPLLLEKTFTNTVLKNVNDSYKDYLLMSAVDSILYHFDGIDKSVKSEFPSMPQLAPSQRLYERTPWFRQGNILMNIEYAPSMENIFKGAANIVGGVVGVAGEYLSDNINKQYSYSYASNKLKAFSYDKLSFKDFEDICKDDKNFGDLYSQSRGFLKDVELGGYNYLRSMDNSYFIVGVNNYTPVSGALSKDGANVQKLIYDSTGDGTVPYLSSSMMQGLEGLATGKRRFYTFRTDHGGTAGHTAIESNKAGAAAALECVVSILNGNTELSLSSAAVKGRKHLVANIQCPVDVKIERNGEMLNSSDSDYSGMTSFGRLDLIGENGDAKSLCIDDELYQVNLTGTGTGTMDMTLEWFDENDAAQVAKQFIDIPVTEKTLMHFETNKDGITTLYADTDGDGTDDQKWYADNGEIGYQLTAEIGGGDNAADENTQTERAVDKERSAGKEEAVAKVQPVSTGKADSSEKKATAASKTGDTNYTALWISLSVVSAGIIGVIIVAIKKRRAQ